MMAVTLQHHLGLIFIFIQEFEFRRRILLSEEKSGLFHHFFNVGIGMIISVIIAFFTTPIITRIFLPGEYGRYTMFLTYGELCFIALCLGMDQALARYYYDCSDLVYKKALLKTCIKYPFVIAIVIVISTLSFQIYKNIYFHNGFMDAFTLLPVYMLVLLINRFLGLLLRLENSTKTYGLISIAQRAVFVLVVFYIYIFANVKNCIGLCISAILAQIACLVIGVWGNRKILLYKNNTVEKKMNTIELLKYAYPFVFSTGIATLFQALDRFFVKYYCGYYEVGVYSSAIAIVHIFSIIQTSFSTVWMPNAIKKYTYDPQEKQYYTNINQMITLIMFGLGTILIASKDLIVLLLGEEYRNAVESIPFLTFFPIMYTISETTVIGLIFMKKSKFQVVAPMLALIVNCIGNIILVPQLGGKGASISTGISYIVFMIVRTFLSNGCYKVDYKLPKFFLVTFLFLWYAYMSVFINDIGLNTVYGIVFLGIIIIMYKESALVIKKTCVEILLKVYNAVYSEKKVND